MERQPASGVFFDDSLWPLLIVRFVGELGPAQLEEHLVTLAGFLEREDRYISLMDASQLSDKGAAEHRRRFLEWMDAHGALLRERLLGSVLLIRSPFLRLMLRVFLHVKPLAVPYVVVSDTREAAAWAAGRLEEVGLPLPAQRIREHFGLPGVHPERFAG